MRAGTEALFADVGHFTVPSIQISMCSVTYPALIFAYAGQAAYLRKNNDHVADTFYKSIPGKRFMIFYSYFFFPYISLSLFFVRYSY